MAKRDLEKFLSTMRDRFTAAQAAETEIRKEAELDLRFVAGEQWEKSIKNQRDLEKLPALTFNHLPTYCQQVANEARQNKPTVKFAPVDSGSDVDTGKVFEGMARGIQYRSRADVAYETAIDYSTAGSFGAFRLATDYCGDSVDEQEIRFEPILDPFSCYGFLIPAIFGKKPKHGFVLETLTREEFEQQYPDSELVSVGFDSGAQQAEGWITSDNVRIAEYWYTESTKRKRRKQILPDGRHKNVYLDELENEGAGVQFATDKDGKPKERVVYEDKIFSCLTNGVEILPDTETEWAGKRIPIFMVLGRQMIVAGKAHLFSLVRFMRDPQQLINIYKSGIAESIGLANKVPYIGYKGQFKDPKWRDANRKRYPYLEAELVYTKDGALAPLPQRQQFEAAVQALSVAAAQEIDDLKSIAGIFDASLGRNGNETSGLAIESRKRQSGVTNYHFLDNLGRAQREAGEEVGYLIPRVYDTEREVRIVGEDEEETVVKVNAPYLDPKTGEQKTHMIEADKYDVTVSIGPTTDTKRQETAQQTGQVIQSAPELMAVIGDIFFRAQDGAGSSELADRMKRWISRQNPGLIEDDGQQQHIPPQVQQKLQQSGQIIDQLTQHVNSLSEEIKTKQFELDSKERLEKMRLDFEREKLQAGVLVEQEKMGHKEAIVALQQQMTAITSELSASRAQAEADAQRSHEAQQLSAQQGHEAGMAQGQQAHEADQADAARAAQPQQPAEEMPEAA